MVKKKHEECKFSWLTNAWKSVKNNVIILGGAAIVHLIESSADWLPDDFKWLNSIIGGLIAYSAKNKVQFKE